MNFIPRASRTQPNPNHSNSASLAQASGKSNFFQGKVRMANPGAILGRWGDGGWPAKGIFRRFGAMEALLNNIHPKGGAESRSKTAVLYEYKQPLRVEELDLEKPKEEKCRWR